MESVHKASEEMNENISNTCKYIGEEKLEQSIE